MRKKRGAGTIDLEQEVEAIQTKPRSTESTCLRRIKNGSKPSDDHVTEIYKDYDLYLATKNGNLDHFKGVLDRVRAAESASLHDILCKLSPARNTFVHVAAKHGNEDIVNFIAAEKPSLMLSKNSSGETALHLAAKAGHESTVKALVKIHKQVLPKKELDENNLLREKNERGNTALHEALFNYWNSIAKYLIEEDAELSYYQNKDGESALYLAAKAGFADLVSLILAKSEDQERVNIEQFEKRPVMQAAIWGAIQKKHRDVLEALLNTERSLIQLRDVEDRTPLHYAASLGCVQEVSFLLNQYPDGAFQRDNSGSFPIHLASIGGHLDAVKLLLKEFPDPGEFLDKDGRNILHLAAMNGRFNIVNFVLKNPDYKELINMKDKQGNVPLHLATKQFHPKIVNALTWDKRVDIKVVNDEGMTALDVAEANASDLRPFTERLTWGALKAAGTPRSLPGYKAIGGKESTNANSCDGGAEGKQRNKDYKERVNTLLIVSTLVATVTFAAGFTMPGGYNSSSDQDSGMATMLRDKVFHMFVFCDTIAMYSSIIVAVVLIWAQLGDLILIHNALLLAEPFLGIALTMMPMAFTAGVFIVVSKLSWLGATVLVISFAFLVILFLVLFPLCIPFPSRNRVLRYLSYYPICLLILATSPKTEV